MIRQPSAIGCAVQVNGGKRRTQTCYGTFAGDIPDPQFRFNILTVEHNGEFPIHSHEYAELVMVLDGSAVHQTDFEQYPIGAGDVFVINGNLCHGFSKAEQLKLCNIMYDPRQFLAGREELAQMMGYLALFDLEPRTNSGSRFRQRLRLSGSQMAYVRSLIDVMSEEFTERREGSQTIITSTFLILVTYLSRLYEQQKSHMPIPAVRMANVVAHISRRFREPIRIRTLAKLAHLSPSQFQRTFKRTYGMSPVRFINRLRIDEACRLLVETDHDVAEVAERTGFASAAFFSTQFKRLVGSSPSAYRKMRASDLAPLGRVESGIVLQAS